ncbi:hypothetical protein [Candidatus Poriferisodalis sp.]|uniref:hypothetical protein n=1 Tax=Candidatus Poriferisodalis sp. TaxID=3101277 RepID=UPI003B024381
MTGSVTSEMQLRQLKLECETSTCFMLPIEEGFSPLDQFVLLAEFDPTTIPDILAFLRRIAHNPVPLYSNMDGESLESFTIDIKDAIDSVLAEQAVPGTGRTYRGLDTNPQPDPLSDFGTGSGVPPGLMLGTYEPFDFYFDGDYIWRGVKTRSFGYFSFGWWFVAGSVQFEYRMSLNGRQVRFWQELTVPEPWGSFKLGYNDSCCRIDRNRWPDRDCDEHPNPSNSLGTWVRSLRQPDSGYDYVYDSSYALKFFEFEHYMKYRISGSGSDETIWRTVHIGQGPRFECVRGSTQACSFV